jgi:hypothetical protein
MLIRILDNYYKRDLGDADGMLWIWSSASSATLGKLSSSSIENEGYFLNVNCKEAAGL